MCIFVAANSNNDLCNVIAAVTGGLGVIELLIIIIMIFGLHTLKPLNAKKDKIVVQTPEQLESNEQQPDIPGPTMSNNELSEL